MGKAAAAWELYRHLNEREGFTRADDRAPDAWFPEEGGTIPGYFGDPLGREDIERLINDYYDERTM